MTDLQIQDDEAQGCSSEVQGYYAILSHEMFPHDLSNAKVGIVARKRGRELLEVFALEVASSIPEGALGTEDKYLFRYGDRAAEIASHYPESDRMRVVNILLKEARGVKSGIEPIHIPGGLSRMRRRLRRLNEEGKDMIPLEYLGLLARDSFIRRGSPESRGARYTERIKTKF